jgi:4-diphosphocytidyl-2-C-methyl-D-erythritol kinase
MVFFPNAKINIGLNIVSKRTDAYHNIETIFFPVRLADVLEFLPSNIKSGEIPYEISFSGLDLDRDIDNNLCIKAYRLLANHFTLPSIKIHLHKIIPIGAGLGGGSSDAAFMIKYLNEAFKLNLSTVKMEEFATALGSDCAFFIQNKPVFATGRGNEFTAIDLNLEGHYLVLVYPNIHVSTFEAYSNVIPKKPEISMPSLVHLPIEQWKNSIFNDFEKSVFARYPEIEKIKKKLYDEGALYASMSGSGSTVYAIFQKYIDLKTKFDNCFVWEEIL